MATSTKTRTVIKPLLTKGQFVFNDRLRDGRRSLKVWGWDKDTYARAKDMLEAAGCRCVIVKTPKRKFYCGGGNTVARNRITKNIQLLLA